MATKPPSPPVPPPRPSGPPTRDGGSIGKRDNSHTVNPIYRVPVAPPPPPKK